MEIRALDANFIPVGLTALRYFDLTWDRKYYEVGMFSMQIRVKDYTSDMQYIYTPERPEIGMIQKVEYSDEDQMVLLRGYFYEGKLADKIVYPTFAKYGTSMMPRAKRSRSRKQGLHWKKWLIARCR